MKAFEEMAVQGRIRAWLGPELYQAGAKASHLRSFQRIVAAARGTPPEIIPEQARLHHHPVLWDTFLGVVDGAIKRALAPHRAPGAGAFALKPGGRDGLVRELVPGTMQACVSLNRAGNRELAGIAGIGDAVAARIVARRETRGPFTNFEELKHIRGFSRAARERAIPFLTLEDPPLPAALQLPDPTGGAGPIGFPDYIRLLHRTGLRVEPDGNPALPPTLAALATSELERIARQAAAAPFWRRDRRADVPDLERRSVACARRESWAAARVSGPALRGVAPLRNHGYFELVTHLLQNATRRIWVQMFYFTSPGSVSPGDALIAELAAAKARGVDVRLIIDTDLGDDYHRAGTINAETLAALTAGGLAFRLDLTGTTTHAKVLLVDDSQLIVGSHNWTTRSAFLLDDTGFYLESRGAAAAEAERFNQCWAAYDPAPATRSFGFGLLRFLLPAERRTLAAAQLAGSGAFLGRFADAAAARAAAATVGLAEDRAEQFWRVLAHMHAFALPEATAFALALTDAKTPDGLLAMARPALLTQLRALPPLSGVYRHQRIRFDVVEAIHG